MYISAVWARISQSYSDPWTWRCLIYQQALDFFTFTDDRFPPTVTREQLPRERTLDTRVLVHEYFKLLAENNIYPSVSFNGEIHEHELESFKFQVERMVALCHHMDKNDA